MNTIILRCTSSVSGPSRLQASLQIGLLFLAAAASSAQTLDPIPVPYCTVAYDGLSSYDLLESKVTASNPQSKAMAQFVLEAFAQANAYGTLLDPQSQTNVVLALNQIQAMWVPSMLNFKSNLSDTVVEDNNSVEFITESLVQISYRFPHLLAVYGPVSQSGTIENLLSTLLAEGQAGAINNRFTVGYTNMWLFMVCNITLTAQGVTDGDGNVLLAPNPQALNRGRSDFMTWVSTVRDDGVHEFMSPTYTGVDLEGLGYLQLYARDKGMAAMAQQASKLLWIDMYANWYNQNQRMGGTHSRTYEFLTDEDRETDRFFYAVSNLTTQPSPAWPMLLNTRSKGYWRGQDFISYVLPPPSDVPYLYGANLAAGSSRTILRSFFSDESCYDPDYMYGENFMANPAGTGGLTYPFSVGSTESFYNDLAFEGLTIMMPGSGVTSNVNYNMQGRQDYYLQILAPDGKSDTLKPFIACVQNAAETLFLASSSATDDIGAVEVASTIVIPNSAQVWIGNASSSVSLTSGQSVSLDPGSTLFIQTSNPGQTDALVTGIRFLVSTDMSGTPINLSLVNDGSSYNALRVTCEHSAGPPTSGQAVIAIWTRTGYCSDTGTNFNLFRNTFISASVTNSYSPSSGAVSLSVPGLNGAMSIDANTVMETTNSLFGSDVDTDYGIPLLSVNGTEYVPGTLQDWTSQDIGNASGGSAAWRTSNGFYTGQVQVIGSGSDIWGTTDGFQFCYQKLVGNGEVIGQVVNMPNGSGISTSVKAGLMMRNDLSSGAMNAFIDLMGGTNGQRFSVRSVPGAVSVRTGNFTTTTPYWFKLTRVKNLFTGYSSPDGVLWTQVGTPTTILMNNTVWVGMAVTSYNLNSLFSPTFANVGVLQQ